MTRIIVDRRSVMAQLASLGVAAPLRAAQAQSADQGVTADTIRVGMTAGISGPIAFGSQQFSGYMQRTFDKVNAAGGVNGRKIALRVLDDGSKGDVALRNTRRLVQEYKVFAVTSIGTPTTAAIVDYLTKQGVPLLFPVAYNAELVEPRRANTFALYQFFDGQIATVTKWAYGKKGAGTAVIVRASPASFDGAANAARKAVTDAGGTVIDTINSAYGQPEWASAVIRIKQLKPDYLILLTTTPDMGRLYKEVIQQSAFPAKATLGISPLGDQAFLDNAGAGIVDDTVFAAVPGTAVPVSAAAKEIRDLWPEQKLGLFGVEGAASGAMMVEAFRQTGPALTRAALMDKLANSFGPFKLPYTGTAKSAPNNLLIASNGIATIRGGTFVPATDEFVE